VNSFQVSPEQALASIIRKSSVHQGKKITYGNMTGSRVPSNLHCARVLTDCRLDFIKRPVQSSLAKHANCAPLAKTKQRNIIFLDAQFSFAKELLFVML
jgi:hypothetical protein